MPNRAKSRPPARPDRHCSVIPDAPRLPAINVNGKASCKAPSNTAMATAPASAKRAGRGSGNQRAGIAVAQTNATPIATAMSAAYRRKPNRSDSAVSNASVGAMRAPIRARPASTCWVCASEASA